jgi:hypothetical protein
MERSTELSRMQELAGQLCIALGQLEHAANSGAVEDVDALEDTIGDLLDELVEQASEKIGYQPEGEEGDDEEGPAEDE